MRILCREGITTTINTETGLITIKLKTPKKHTTLLNSKNIKAFTIAVDFLFEAWKKRIYS